VNQFGLGDRMDWVSTGGVPHWSSSSKVIFPPGLQAIREATVTDETPGRHPIISAPLEK